MHTQEQRTKAVMLFIETGFNHAAVKSALGYPSRWSLDRWYADYLDKGYVKEKREHWEKFSDEEKAAAVAKYFELGRHLSNTVKELGYPSRALLYQWIDELAPGMRKKTKPHRKHDDAERANVEARAPPSSGGTSAATSAGRRAIFDCAKPLCQAPVPWHRPAHTARMMYRFSKAPTSQAAICSCVYGTSLCRCAGPDESFMKNRPSYI